MSADRPENADTPDIPTPRRTVYVRAVPTKDVMAELADAPDVDLLPVDADMLYAVHASDGARLALVSDRETAFAAARQNDMKPVSVH